MYAWALSRSVTFELSVPWCYAHQPKKRTMATSFQGYDEAGSEVRKKLVESGQKPGQSAAT